MFSGKRFVFLRAFFDKSYHIAVTHAEHRRVHHEKGQQAHAHMQITVRRNRVFSALQSVNDPRLATHFGRHPARQNRDKARRPHQQGKPQERTRGINALFITQPQRHGAQQQHQHPEPRHDTERPENDSGIRAIFFWKILKRRNLLVQTVRQDKTAERGDFQTIASPFLFHIRPAKQQQRRGFTGWIFPVAFDSGNFGGLVF
ncbi:hypothetical protein D3C78_1111390 [compost metagenome]